MTNMEHACTSTTAHQCMQDWPINPALYDLLRTGEQTHDMDDAWAATNL
jgi:hypothetical protein